MLRSLDRLRREAKALRRAFDDGEADALARVAEVFPERDAIKHADALHVIAQEAGHASWPKLKMAAEIGGMDRAARAERLKIALFYGQGWVIERLLDADPSLPDDNLGLQIAMYRMAAVERALSEDRDAAAREIGVRSPILHLASSQYWRLAPGGAEASIALADLLVRHGADVNDSYPSEPGSPHELSALYGALGHAGNVELAQWLLENGADPNDNESLYHATELGHADGVRMLLAHGARVEGTNALLRAMDFDSVEMVRMMLEAGADPDEKPAQHPSGQPNVVIPGLHHAARRNCSGEMGALLIAHGADGTSTWDGHTAYAIARMRGNAGLAEVLERHGQATELSESEAAIAAAVDGLPATVPRSDLSAQQRSILHAVLEGDDPLERVKRLISAGIDPDWEDVQQMPAVHLAAWMGHRDAVEFLLGFGPDLEKKNMYGGDLMGTVIHGAEFCPERAQRDHLGAARLILDAGSRLHVHDIVHCGVEEMVEMLWDWAEAHPDKVVRDA